MTTFKGIFSLQKPQDLLKKLEYDYQRIIKNPLDTYAVFDFFVTAEHIVDWLYPSSSPTDKRNRERLRRKLPLQICSQIANGSKHFEATAKQHKTVKGTNVRPGAELGLAILGVSRLGTGSGLEIKLKNYAKRRLGEYIDANNLAKIVLDFWRGYF